MSNPSKKFIIAFCALVIFVVSVSIFLFNITQRKPETTQPFPAPTPIIITKTSAPILSPVNIPPYWNSQQDTRYAVAYPANWRTLPEPAEGRDVYMSFLPDNKASDDAFPIFIVQVYLANETTVEQRISELSPLGLQQSTITFQGNQAVQLRGILPFTFISGDPQNKPVLKTYILFENNNRLYVIDYAYYQDENSQAQQQLFDQILATLALPQ